MTGHGAAGLFSSISEVLDICSVAAPLDTHAALAPLCAALKLKEIHEPIAARAIMAKAVLQGVTNQAIVAEALQLGLEDHECMGLRIE